MEEGGECRVKKRFAATVLAVAMLLSLCPAAMAEDLVYFTAVDERVLDLNDSTMPFWFGGYLYVAATVFRESGVGYSYNIVSQTLVLYDSSHSLVYDVSTGSGTDGQGDVYDHVCVTRGGVTFVAASPVASYFGRTYTNTRVNHGYLIRVKSSSAVLPDSMFTETATYQMETKYQQYQKNTTAVQTPDRDPTGTETTDPTENTAGKSIYLCFLAEDANTVSEWLDAMENRGGHAAFYFTEAVLARCGDQLRRLAASGCAIGLVPSSEDNPAEQLDRMNKILFAAAGVKTRLVYGAGADITTLQSAGYCPLTPGIDRSRYGLNTSGESTSLLKQIRSRRSAVSVWLGSGVTAGALRTFLSSASAEGDRLLSMTEIAS